MKTIRAKFHADIQAAAAQDVIPAEFYAALIANESGGDPTKKRFEKTVLAGMWEVLLGRAAAFGSLGRTDLWDYIIYNQEYPGMPTYVNLFGALWQLDTLATSWGLTQIMGYESIALGVPLLQLQMTSTGLNLTRRMLQEFAMRFKLDASKDFSPLFACWNTGRPNGKTADPDYEVNGLSRMAIFRDLNEEPPRAISA